MASLEYDANSGRYRIRFRYANIAYKRALKSKDKREAAAIVSRAEETIRLLEHGRLEIPAEADPGTFILSDGKLNGKPTAPTVRTLDDLFEVIQGETAHGRQRSFNS